MKNILSKQTRKELKESIPAYLLIAPTIIVLIIFLYIPFVNTFRISLYNYKGFGAMTDFVGFANFAKVLSDAKFYQSFLHTFQIIVCDLIFSLAIGFLLAYVLFRGIRLKKFLNAALFIPYLISNVVVACIWRIIYDPTIGPLNQLLEAIGLEQFATAWLSNTSTALICVTITWIWKTIPFNMLILYANIMSLPEDYIEAATLDGATAFQRIRYIILPYLKPAFAQLALLTVTNGLRAFDLVWNMTSGGPAGYTEVVTSYIYQKAFQSQRFGTASAASIIMMAAMIIFNFAFQAVKGRRSTNE